MKQTTVIVPVRNGASHVIEALQSVIVQISESEDEIVVVDDGSTDGTDQLVQRHVPKAVLIRGSGLGPSGARNRGLAVAQGEFVAFLDHDDLWPAERHRVLLEALISRRDAGLSIGRTRVQYDRPKTSPYYDFLEGQHHPVMIGSCLYRRSWLLHVGPFEETMRFGEDFDYYVRQIEAGLIMVQCDVDALIYRRHHNNLTLEAPDQSRILTRVLARKLARSRAATGPQPSDSGNPT